MTTIGDQTSQDKIHDSIMSKTKILFRSESDKKNLWIKDSFFGWDQFVTSLPQKNLFDHCQDVKVKNTLSQ